MQKNTEKLGLQPDSVTVFVLPISLMKAIISLCKD